MRLLVSLAAVIALAAAPPSFADAPKEPPKPQKDEMPTEDAEKFLAFFHRFADAVVQNKDACPRMATAINGVIDGHQGVIKRANELRAANKKLPKAVEDQMTTRLKEMFAAMVKCKDDAGVKAAMRRIEGPASATKKPAR